MPAGFYDRHPRYFTAPDEDENTYLNPSLREVQTIFDWATWQSHLVNFLNNERMRSSRLLNTKPQDDACNVRWDPRALTKRGLRMTAILNINGFSGQIDRNTEFCFLTDKIIWVDLNSLSFYERQMILIERPFRNHMITNIMNWRDLSYQEIWFRNS